MICLVGTQEYGDSLTVMVSCLDNLTLLTESLFSSLLHKALGKLNESLFRCWVWFLQGKRASLPVAGLIAGICASQLDHEVRGD